MRIRVPRSGLGLLAVLAAASAATAQELPPFPLARAFAIGDSLAYANRIAEANRSLRASERDQTLKGLLPSLRVEGGWTRTTDPLNAFGFTLRQRGVTDDGFHPARLNSPEPTSNVNAGLVAEVPLLNPDAWLGRGAAARAVDAAESMTRWTRATARVDVVRAYFGGVLAREQVAALEAGWSAALSHVRLAGSLQAQGLVTRSDVLLAQLKAGELESQLLGARGQAALSLRRLALSLGLTDSAGLELPEALPDTVALTRLTTDSAAGVRADVAAARLGAEAAARDVGRATSLLLPRINSFGRIDWNQPDQLFGGQPAWTVGVVASWSVFGGGSELVARQAASARAAAAATQAEAAEAQAALDRAARRTELDVAIAATRIAYRAVEQAAEAHRIVLRKYEGGLATITELLESSAVETRSRVERAAALYRAIVAAAEWQIATGNDGSALLVLDHD